MLTWSSWLKASFDALGVPFNWVENVTKQPAIFCQHGLENMRMHGLHCVSKICGLNQPVMVDKGRRFLYRNRVTRLFNATLAPWSEGISITATCTIIWSGHHHVFLDQSNKVLEVKASHFTLILKTKYWFTTKAPSWQIFRIWV